MSANKVVPNLFLGDWQDAQTFDGERLCVLEGNPLYAGMTHHVPILVSHPTYGMVASRASSTRQRR